MKQIITSLSLLTVVGALMISGTAAFFSDTEISTGNSFAAAGTLDLTINGSDSWATEFTLSDAMPGDTQIVAPWLQTNIDAWLRAGYTAIASTTYNAASSSALLADLNFVVYESSTSSPNTINPLTKASDGYYYPTDPLLAGNDDYTIGFYLCFGEISSTTPTDLASYTCSGAAVGNDAQGGLVDITFEVYAEQYQNNNQITYAIGDTGPGGGIVFYLEPGSNGSHGLELTPADQSGGVYWGTSGTVVGGTENAVGTGAANTDLMLANDASTLTAATVARDYQGGGYDDWFLPSRDELQLAVDAGYLSISDDYWTSTEHSAIGAVSLKLGLYSITAKNVYKKVRAVRAF